MSDLVTMREVADRLGVGVSRARQISRRPDFPEPVAIQTPVRLFRADEVERFAASYTPRPVGRPRQNPNEECQK